MLRRVVPPFVAALLLAAGAAVPGPAYAMGDSDPPPRAASNPDFDAGRKAIDAKDWKGAAGLFQKVVAQEPKNADAFNYLGYAYRNLGDYDSAFRHYGQALTLNPRHKGAHEYIGEAYLKTGNLAKAEEHLAALDRICVFGCAEYTELKTKVAAFKSGKSS